MTRLTSAALPCACRMLLVAALVAGVAAADAKGRRGGSSGGSRSPAPSKVEVEKPESGGFKPNLNLARRGSSSSSQTQPAALAGAGAGAAAEAEAGDEPAPAVRQRMSREELDEFRARVARGRAIERSRAEKAAADLAAAEKAEADRVAAEQAAARRSALAAAEEKAEAARQRVAQEKKKREDAIVAGDVDRVLQRAKADYPLLQTQEGAQLLRKIMERQQELVARGSYPSIAMVEAVSNYEYALAAPRTPAVQATLTPVRAEAAGAEAMPLKTSAGCRWVTPIRLTCD